MKLTSSSALLYVPESNAGRTQKKPGRLDTIDADQQRRGGAATWFFEWCVISKGYGSLIQIKVRSERGLS